MLYCSNHNKIIHIYELEKIYKVVAFHIDSHINIFSNLIQNTFYHREFRIFKISIFTRT